MPKRKQNTSNLTDKKKKQKQKQVQTVVTNTAANNANTAIDHDEEPWSKSKKKRMRKIMARNNRNGNNNNNNNSNNNNSDDNNNRNDNKNRYLGNHVDEDEDEDADEIETTTATTTITTTITAPTAPTIAISTSNKKPMSELQQKFLSRLAGSRFRELNEELYTTNSSSALERFSNNPELFTQYHEGFRTQVNKWPVNPIDVIYRWIITLYQKQCRLQHQHDKQHTNNSDGNSNSNKNSNKQTQLRIADFGCGEAKLAEKLVNYQPKSNNNHTKKKNKNKKEEKKNDQKNPNSRPFKIHSFDLVANGNPLITPCDMSNVPLKNGSVDVGVFVLALMGTNIADFIREAHRVLTPNGILKIAEVRSRFESSSSSEEQQQQGGGNGIGNGSHHHNMKKQSKKQQQHQQQQKYNYSKKPSDDQMLNDFLDVMEELGFRCVKKDRQNKMFMVLEFEKTGLVPSKKALFTAKPCIYKRR